MIIGNSLQMCLRNAAALNADGLYSDAKDEFIAAINLQPSGDLLSEIYFQLGICYMKLKDFFAAEEYLVKSEDILRGLDVLEISHIVGALILLYETSGNEEKLRDYCLDVLAKDSFNIDACLALADLYAKQRNYTEAERIIKNALKFGNDDLRVLKTCICIETKLDKYRDALEHSKRFFQLNNGIDFLVNTAVADILQKIGPIEESLRLYREVYDICDDHVKFGLGTDMLAASLYDEVYSKDKYSELYEFRLKYTSKLQISRAFANDTALFKKLRIAYMSDDFKRHPVGFFVAPVLKRSRESQSEFLCYNLTNLESRDDVGDFICKGADTLSDMYDKKDDELEQYILDDNPDILMELKSTTVDNKLELYAKRLAPLQISWIGFPISSGVAAIDYIIADRCVDPYPEAQELYSEKLLYLKDTFLCHEIIIDEGGKELPCSRNKYITFGCFNNYIKITDRMLKLWSEILKSVSNSKIIFKAHKYDDDYVVELFEERLSKFGFNPESFVIEPAETMDKYFKSYGEIDIVLDTYPFNGATTTFDALLLGTPVVTLVGEAHHSRVGLDLLSHVCLEDLACRSDREYVEKAITLANDIERLIYLRNNLRDITRRSKLTDANAFRIEYEYALRKAWVDYCVKKRNEDNIVYNSSNKSVKMLRDELLNGADYIRKCINEAEFTKDIRCLLLDEYITVHSSFMKSILQHCEDINSESIFVLKRLNTLVCKIRDMNNDQIVKILESNVVVLERLL